jgi:hypothetical protein
MTQNNSNTTTMTTRNDLFDEIEPKETSITYISKKGVEWKDINDFLERFWCKNSNDPHWKWRGFGDSEKGFTTIVVRRPCSSAMCDAEECDECGQVECELEEDEEGVKRCSDCC